MGQLYNKDTILAKFYRFIPITFLFIAVLNEIDFNNLGLKYFSFNFSYILIFYYSLKKSESLGYGLIFIAGLFNDVVTGVPIGLSGLLYLLLCGTASYLRNITLRPNLMKDWMFFLMAILIINSISFLILTLIFDYEIIFLNQILNIIFTFFLYFAFSQLFDFFGRFLIGKY
jgi:rod shape-determining protein MreD